MERRALPLEPGFATLIITAYEGDRGSEGRYCGRGKAQFKDGHQYHGEGRYVWDNGTVLEGTFKHNVVEGKGTYTWPDGSTYAGDVLDGLHPLTNQSAHTSPRADRDTGRGCGSAVQIVAGAKKRETRWSSTLAHHDGDVLC